jgi:hypothetical protein
MRDPASLANMGFFDAGELRERALAGDHPKAFEAHGVVAAIVIAASWKAGLKGVVHGASIESGMSSAEAISCHFRSDASIVSSTVRSVSKRLKV